MFGEACMTPTDYRKILEDSKRELEELLIKQDHMERRIARLRQAILALTPLAPEESLAADGTNRIAAEGALEAMGIGSGMTDACRQILKAASGPLTPVEVRRQAIAMGVDLSRHKNVMANIHSTLKRLARKDEIETKDKGLTYQWKPRRSPRLPLPPTATESLRYTK